MAVTVTNTAGQVWTTTAGNKTTTAFTPAANDLLVAFVGIATLDTAPTMSDSQGGSWVLVDSFRSQAATGGLRAYARSQPVTATSMTVTMTISGDAGGGLGVLRVAGSSAWMNFPTFRSTGGQADVGTGTPAPVLSQTPLTTSAVIIGLMNNTNGTANQTVRAGYTEHWDLGFNTPTSGFAAQSRNSGETSATLTFGGTTPSTFATIALEITDYPTLTSESITLNQPTWVGKGP